MFGVTTDIPPHQGLKSSSSISVMTIRALADHAGLDLTDERTVHLAVTAQRTAGVTLTGAVDDTWACATPMWHLVDVRNQEHPVILNSGEAPSQDHTLMIAIGGTPRQPIPTQTGSNSGERPSCKRIRHWNQAMSSRPSRGMVEAWRQ